MNNLNVEFLVNNIDMDSVKQVTGQSEQTMIYGWDHCGYVQLIKRLKKPDSPIKSIFTWSLGQNRANTLENRTIEQVNVPNIRKFVTRRDMDCTRYCKAGLTNMVLENYKRSKEGKTLIPILFIFDRDRNPFAPVSSTVTLRGADVNDLVTSSELRRSYKLCQDVGNRKIEEVARQTFKFIKLTEDPNTHKTNLTAIEPIWNSPTWDVEWKERKAQKTSKQSDKTKDVQWREQIKQRADAFDLQFMVPHKS